MTQRIELEHLLRAPSWGLRSQGMEDQKHLFQEGIPRVGGSGEHMFRKFQVKAAWPFLTWPQRATGYQWVTKTSPNLGNGKYTSTLPLDEGVARPCGMEDITVTLVFGKYNPPALDIV